VGNHHTSGSKSFACSAHELVCETFHELFKTLVCRYLSAEICKTCRLIN